MDINQILIEFIREGINLINLNSIDYHETYLYINQFDRTVKSYQTTSTFFDNNHKRLLQIILIHFSLSQEPRIRTSSISCLIEIHFKLFKLDHDLNYPLACILLQDDWEKIRKLSLILLYQMAIMLKTKLLEHYLYYDVAMIKSHLQNEMLTLINGSNTVYVPEQKFLELPLPYNNYVDDAFMRICKLVINDISPDIRALAVKLLSESNINQQDSLISSEFFSKFKNLDDCQNFAEPSDSDNVLWPINSELLLQTLDKRILVSNMRRKRDFHERTRLGHITGEGRTGANDRPMERIIDENVISAEAGAFVHGLEDEDSQVRILTIQSMTKLALRLFQTTEHGHHLSSIFAHKVVEFFVDMFNDELASVRLKAIIGLETIVSHVPVEKDGKHSHRDDNQITFRADQIEIILSALEDFDDEIRKVLRTILAQCKVTDIASTALVVRYLLYNLIKYPQDFQSICETFRDFAYLHSAFVMRLIPDLLCIDSPYTSFKRISFDLLTTSANQNSNVKGGDLDKNKTLDDSLVGVWPQTRDIKQLLLREGKNLCLDFHFDPTEPDITQNVVYIATLVLILNAIDELESQDTPYTGMSLLPSFVIDRHSPYLRQCFPQLFKTEISLRQPGCIKKSKVAIEMVYKLCQMYQTQIYDNFIDSNNFWIQKRVITLLDTCQNISSISSKYGAFQFSRPKSSCQKEFDFTIYAHNALVCLGSCADFTALILAFYVGAHKIFNEQNTINKTFKPSAYNKVNQFLYKASYTFLGLSNTLKINLTKLHDNFHTSDNFETNDLEHNQQDTCHYKLELLNPIVTDIITEIYQFYIKALYEKNAVINMDTNTLSKSLPLLYHIKAHILHPMENKDRDISYKFISGFSLKATVLADIAPEINLEFLPEQKRLDGVDDNNMLGLNKIEDLFQHIKIKIKYPDLKCISHPIPINCFIKQSNSHGYKVQHNIYIESEHPWTDPAYVEFNLILELNSILPKDNPLYNAQNDDIMLASPIKILIHPKPIP